MTTAKLRQVGGSTMVAIPPGFLRELPLGPGSTVDIVMEKGALVIKPARPRYTLEELLAQCDPDAPLTEEDREWLDDAPAGGEMI